MKAKELEKLFDDGKDIAEFLDLSKTARPNEKLQRVNVDFPVWMVEALDKESKRLGVPRQSVIKFWVAENLSKYSV
jgi:hypothetical protein